MVSCGKPHRTGRRGYKTGYQVFHRFVVTQGARSDEALGDLQRFFAVGRLHLNTRHDNHREDLLQYHVSRRDDLLGAVIPFYRENTLRTSKKHHFTRFAECVELVAAGHHLTADGLIRIARITEQTNHRKPRTDLIRILRDHTPNALDTG